MATDPTPNGAAVWLVRPGRGGCYAESFRACSMAALAVPFRRDAREATTEAVIQEGESSGRAPGVAATLRRFALDVKVGDIIISPVPKTKRYLIGSVAGEYVFVPEAEVELRHIRQVVWQLEVDAREVPSYLRRALGAPIVLYRPVPQAELRTFLERHGLPIADVPTD